MRPSTDFRRFEAISFDCYGTLIDWESGLLPPLRALLAANGVAETDDALLERYARHESDIEAGPYQPYRDVLRRVVQAFGRDYGFTPTESEQDSLPESLPEWPPFPDTVAALRVLKPNHRLVIISNIDDDLFAATARRLEVPFDGIVTAQQAGAYKPSSGPFELALARVGVAPENWLHVGQSLYHDIPTARALGMTTVWVNRRQGREGSGATLPNDATPDREVPDLQTLASLMSR